MTTARLTPRALLLAASIGWRHLTADPVRAVLLAWRVLPDPAGRWLRFAGPYGRAAVLWGTGERDAALAALSGSPRREAAFALASDQPATAAAAVRQLGQRDPARPEVKGRPGEAPARGRSPAGSCTWSRTRCRPPAPGTRSGRTRSCWPSAPPGSIRTW